ncbi:hypothetical protein NC651_002200 [Populus alba x Populus x berolinensis]|nr:hypothetical protein NC651_002200 [Populus alba x Populus x berolinensis]
MIRGIYHFSPILRLSTLPIFLCYVVCEQTCSPLTGTHIADNLGRTLESEHLLVGVFRWLEDSLPIIALLVKWQAAVESCAFSILYFLELLYFSYLVSCLKELISDACKSANNAGVN